MDSNERRKRRYKRRQAKRKANRQKVIDSIGSAKDVFNYHDMFKYGEECCRGVMWKQSTQTFNRHLFSRTAMNRKRALGDYKPRKLASFTITERGKVRNIEAPHVDDRQIQKTLTKKVLIPLYTPRLITDNGASLKGKGLHYAQDRLDKALHDHYKKYGLNGWIITADYKSFFPNADRDVVKRRHDEIKDPKLRAILNTVSDSGKGDRGLPIGVEPSQIEMIALPSPVDNYMNAQAHVVTGHYMDDYHILVPPDKNPKEILELFIRKSEECGLVASRDKTRITPFGKPFKYCKCKRILYGDKVVKRGCPDSIKRTKRKIKKFALSQMPYEEIYQSLNASISYLDNYNEHRAKTRLTRMFYRMFGFRCNIKEFRRQDNEIHLPQAV